MRELQNFWKPSDFGIQQSIFTVKINAAIGVHEREPGCETQKHTNWSKVSQAKLPVTYNFLTKGPSKDQDCIPKKKEKKKIAFQTSLSIFFYVSTGYLTLANWPVGRWWIEAT